MKGKFLVVNVLILGLLTLNLQFTKGQYCHFSKTDMDHAPCRHGKNISDMTWAIPYIRHATLDHFKIGMQFANRR